MWELVRLRSLSLIRARRKEPVYFKSQAPGPNAPVAQGYDASPSFAVNPAMSNLVFCPFEVDIENMASDLAQLEAEYAEKRKSESEIQDIISKVDQRAIEELKSTEEELQEVNLKCAAIVARLERAAGGAGGNYLARNGLCMAYI